MVEVPTVLIVLLVLFACTREFYHVIWMRQYGNIGTLFAFGYMAAVYAFITWGGLINVNFHGSPFVRLGIFLIFLDKAIAFGFEIFVKRMDKWKTT